MHVERVHVRAFGPFRDRSIELAPGLTVVFGPNEAGKSSWHAALYAALCGLRRGQGATKEDRDFAARHRPWAGDGWQATAIVKLADSRRVEIRQDLEHRVECSARDLVLGSDLSSEIIADGTPDGSRWLGLDRRTFLATACVRQADILEVLRSAEGLQEHLQRAVATGGADETAAGALALLDEFERDHVGRDQANSTKPLRRARDRLAIGERQLEQANSEHQRYLARAEEADKRELEAVAREHERAAFEAALTKSRAAAWRGSYEQARQLQSKLVGEEPQPLAEGDEVGRQVAGALLAYDSMPPTFALDGPTAGELAAELDTLPPMPEGDLQLHHGVTAALATWRAAAQALAGHDRQRPAEPRDVDTPAPAATLRTLAADLEADAASKLTAATRQLPLWPGLAVGAVVALAGVLLAVIGQLGPGVVTLVVGALMATATALAMAARSRGASLDEVRVAEAKRRRAAAEARATELGLSPRSELLLLLAEQADAAELQRRQLDGWWSARHEHERLRTNAANALQMALAERGAVPGPDLERAFLAYEQACRDRAEQARAAARRADLERQLRQRQELDANAERTERRRQDSTAALHQAAEQCSIPGADEHALAEGLREWLAGRSEELSRREDELGERGHLAALLGGGTLQDLEARAAGYERRAQELAASFDASELDRVSLDDSADGRLSELAQAANRARAEAATAVGEVSTLAERLPSVAGAEEELAAASAELSRVQGLAATLRMTRRYLEAAEEHVHRDVAPVLKRKLEAWLPRITGGRYCEAIVTPETLEVQVRAAESEWRDARLLSHGTREQIYLLLRLALMEHLGNAAEPCPLVLDDVTVQSDSWRTTALLELIHEISREHQVVLFSQEVDVRVWAERHLVEPHDNLLVLDATAVSA